jgi:thiamine kinase-like enzyme
MFTDTGTLYIIDFEHAAFLPNKLYDFGTLSRQTY